MFEIGQKVSIEKVFNEEEVLNFSKMSMDDNPIHFDKDYAHNSRFKQRIVQGPFVTSLIGGLLGSKLPGPGTIYINQNTQFLKPVFIGDKVTASIEIKEIREDKPSNKTKNLG
ncbi:MaoC family dehydratase [Antarcticibacterium sp. 1MA-6-2]|uniref:MaoC family dehydratase n=1 Tax=Antarcticibacterium sp. 1MA-6-2 TaxID=2908210 RepID=UPI001F3384E9|nr:MaoC family dehydratase [Antarcticibacterium sp. 1MA-6-2]UJH91301.1 MaoC family dehydratase [Antarcticibacterium sp. 1MA-6-2]